MAENNENGIQKTYRLPAAQVELIELLAARKILGTNRSDVVRALLNNAIKELIESEFVKKSQETLALLRKK